MSLPLRTSFFGMDLHIRLLISTFNYFFCSLINLLFYSTNVIAHEGLILYIIKFSFTRPYYMTIKSSRS